MPLSQRILPSILIKIISFLFILINFVMPASAYGLNSHLSLLLLDDDTLTKVEPDCWKTNRCQFPQQNQQLKSRIIISTDMAGQDPDDTHSLFLLCK